MRTQPFASPEEALAYLQHYGVKGMRWGVRKEDLPSGRGGGKAMAELNTSAKGYMSAAATMNSVKLSPEQRVSNIIANQKRFLAKFEPSEAPGVTPGKIEHLPTIKPTPGKAPKGEVKIGGLDAEAEKHGLTRSEKIQIGLALGAIGGALAYGAYANRYAMPPDLLLDNTGLVNALNPLKGYKPGQKLGPGAFIQRAVASQNASYDVDSFFRPESFSRPAFELPAGHVFQRISAAAESTFAPATYCTADPDDHVRYALALGVQSVKRHQISFTATSAIKVPALTDVLNEVHQAMADEGLKPFHSITEREVLERYKSISHQQWKGDEATALIKRLKSKGFGAIVDEMDSGVFSDRPLVLFSDHVSPKKDKILTAKDMRKLATQLKDINNPPGRKLELPGHAAPKSLWEDIAAQIEQEKVEKAAAPQIADMFNQLMAA